MGELRLYAIGIDEVRNMFGAPHSQAGQLREMARQALTPPAPPVTGGLLTKLGPIFRRVPAAPVIPPTQPTPADLETLLAGGHVPPDRTGATWRVLEILVQGCAWGSTALSLDQHSMDELDFELARGGVAAAVGLRHLLSSPTSINLLPAPGLTVGWHPYEKALQMADAYRRALPQLATSGQQQAVALLVRWMEGFPQWAQMAPSRGRDIPDLMGFWAN